MCVAVSLQSQVETHDEKKVKSYSISWSNFRIRHSHFLISESHDWISHSLIRSFESRYCEFENSAAVQHRVLKHCSLLCCSPSFP